MNVCCTQIYVHKNFQINFREFNYSISQNVILFLLLTLTHSNLNIHLGKGWKRANFVIEFRHISQIISVSNFWCVCAYAYIEKFSRIGWCLLGNKIFRNVQNIFLSPLPPFEFSIMSKLNSLPILLTNLQTNPICGSNREKTRKGICTLDNTQLYDKLSMPTRNIK